MRRWWDRKLIQRHFVEFNGDAVGSVKTGFRRAVSLAGLSGKVTPHTLRHTAATWLMQSGTDRWQAASYLGMSVETLEKVYGHHHPDYLQAAVAAISNGSRTKREQMKTVSVGFLLGHIPRNGRPRRAATGPDRSRQVTSVAVRLLATP